MAGARLVVVEGDQAGTIVPLPLGQEIVIGRSPESDLRLLDDEVSRVHCIIRAGASGCLLSDLGSKNGTYVDGRRVKSRQLVSGDRIGVGAAILQFLVVDQAGRSGPSVTLVSDEAGAQVEATKDPASLPASSAEGTVAALTPEQQASLEEFSQDLETIYKVVNVVSAEKELGPLLKTVTDLVFRRLQPERVALLLVDEETETVHTAAVRCREEAGADELQVSKVIVEQSLHKGLCVISSDATAEEQFQTADGASGVRSVMCVPVQCRDKIFGAIYVDSRQTTGKFSQQDLSLVAAIARQAGLAIYGARLFDGLESLFLGLIKTLVAAIEANDMYVYGHSERVTKYSLEIARELGQSTDEVSTLEIAGWLHDIGKISISEHTLNKSEGFSEAEWELVRSHPEIGQHIIEKMSHKRMNAVLPIIRHHHERFDGHGYPDGLEGEAIPLGARILAVADAFDAMTSNRPYHAKLPSAEGAMAELRGHAGGQFDPAVVEAMARRFKAGRIVAPPSGGSILTMEQTGGQVVRRVLTDHE